MFNKNSLSFATLAGLLLCTSALPTPQISGPSGDGKQIFQRTGQGAATGGEFNVEAVYSKDCSGSLHCRSRIATAPELLAPPGPCTSQPDSDSDSDLDFEFGPNFPFDDPDDSEEGEDDDCDEDEEQPTTSQPLWNNPNTNNPNTTTHEPSENQVNQLQATFSKDCTGSLSCVSTGSGTGKNHVRHP